MHEWTQQKYVIPTKYVLVVYTNVYYNVLPTDRKWSCWLPQLSLAGGLRLAGVSMFPLLPCRKVTFIRPLAFLQILLSVVFCLCASNPKQNNKTNVFGCTCRYDEARHACWHDDTFFVLLTIITYVLSHTKHAIKSYHHRRVVDRQREVRSRELFLSVVFWAGVKIVCTFVCFVFGACVILSVGAWRFYVYRMICHLTGRSIYDVQHLARVVVVPVVFRIKKTHPSLQLYMHDIR